MQNLKNKINDLLLARKQHRKAVIAIAALSLLVVVGVCASLIVPAVSYAGADEGGTGYPYEEAPLNAHLFKPDIVNVSATQLEAGPGEDEAISVNFELSYTIDNKTLLDGNYIYYNLNTDRADTSGAKIVIPSGGLPAGDGLGDVTMGGVKVGTYRIEEDGLVVIRFSDDYRENTALKLEDGVTRTGTLSFEAGVKGAEGSSSDDIVLDFSGNGDASTSPIISGFVYSNVSIEKTAPPQLNDDRTLEWAITVSNPDGADLGGLIIKDNQFANAKAGSIVCSAGQVVADSGETTVVLDSTTAETVTITYTTEVSASDYGILLNGGSVNNTATVNKPATDRNPNGTVLDEASAGIKIPSQIISGKEGSVVYGKDSDSITWTITIKNPNGLDLGGYYLNDSKFSGLTGDSIACNVPYMLENTEGNSRLVFESGADAEEITVSFTTTIDKTTATDSDYKNDVWLYAPDRNTNQYTYANVQRYQITAGKSGQVVAGQPMIDWSVTVADRLSDDEVSFKDLVIQDDMLLNLLNSLSSEEERLAAVNITANGISGTVPFVLVKDVSGNVTGVRVSDGFDASQISPDYQGFRYITLSYRTDAVVDGFSTEVEPGVYETTNRAGIVGVGDAENIEITDLTKTVTYTKRADVAKTHGTAKLSEDKQSLIVPWTIQIDGEEGTFEAMVLVDTMSASAGENGETALGHTFSGLTKVSAKTVSAGDRDLSDTEYTLTLTDSGFEISLNEDVLGEDFIDSIIAMTIQYESLVALDYSVLNTGDTVRYKNTVEVIDKTGEDSGEYTVVNPDSRLLKESLYSSTDLELEDLETATVNGVESYLFKWKLTLNENGDYSGKSSVILTDTLPKGFKLYEGANKDTGFYGEYADKNKEAFTNNIYNWLGYQVDSSGEQQVVTFGTQVFGYRSETFSIYYVTYIPKEELKELVGNDSYPVENKVTDGEVEKSVELNITPGENVIPINDGMITKTALEQTMGGYISYTVDFNPEALDLIEGGNSIVLQDNLDFGSSYYPVAVVNGTKVKGELVNESPTDLLHVTLNSILFYEVDEEGNKTLLDPQPQYVFEDSPKNTITDNPTYTEVFSDFQGNAQYYQSKHYYKFSDVRNGSTLTVRVKKEDAKALTQEIAAYTAYGNLTCALSKVDDYTYVYTIDVNANTAPDKVDVYVGWGANDNYSEEKLPDVVESAVSVYHEKLADASLTMTVPDGKHIEIEYTYKALSEEVYSVPHMENSVTAVSKYANHGDSKWVEFQAYNNSTATVLSDLTIEKTDASNSAVKLDAGFHILRYNASAGQWEYAQGLKKVGGKVVVESWGTTAPAEELFSTSVSKMTPFTIHLGSYDENGDGIPDGDSEGIYLYYLEETRVPEGYDTSFRDNKYFVYNAKVSEVTVPFAGPDGTVINKSDILTLSTDSTLGVKNRKDNIAVSATKTWSDGNENHSEDISLELWSSPTLAISATELPSDAVKVYDAVVISAVSGSWTHTWDSLPSTDEDGKVIYYYVKEVDCTGDYTPLYVGNGLNDTGTVEVINSRGITLTKEWVYDNGKTIPDSVLPDSIQVKLYRSTELSAELPEDAELVQPLAGTEYYTVYKEKDWTLDITGLAKDDGEGHTYYYYAEEVSVSGYQTEYPVNGSAYNGMLTVRNVKDSEAGITLPSAGGHGTAQLIGFGALLVAIAVFALVIVKRKSGAVNDRIK